MNNHAPHSPPTGIPLTYEETLRYLCRPVSKSTYPGDLTPLKTLLARLGQPEKRFRPVIVTGSVGKGTVAHLLAAALRAAGIRAGLFSGPHLHHYRERMAIDGQPISIPALIEQVKRIRPHVTGDLGRLSTFELATALAFDWFAAQEVEIAILEVGVGGRYDAVNLAPAESAIITPIELEHTILLGNSLTKIAHHKADVIPEGGFVVAAPQPPEVLQIITATCRERNATLVYAPEAATWNRAGRDTYQVSVGNATLRGQTPLLGKHNALNIATVLAWVMQAAGRAVPVSPAHVAQAARHLHMPGRVELVQRDGAALLIDGAHTPTGANALADTIQSLALPGPVTYLVSLSRDKNARGFLNALRIPKEATLILTTYKGHRAMPLADLTPLAAEMALNAEATPNLSDALDNALARHTGAGLIVVTGSLFLAAQTREKLGLLSDDLLAEARLTRAIFSGPDYLAQVASDSADRIARLPSI